MKNFILIMERITADMKNPYQDEITMLRAKLPIIFDDFTLVQIHLVKSAENSDMYTTLALNLLDRLTDNNQSPTKGESTLKTKKFSVTDYLIGNKSEDTESMNDSSDDELETITE